MSSKEILTKLVEARQKLSERREKQKKLKPKDIQTVIILGCRMKGLQQAIDIVNQAQADEEMMRRLQEEGFAAHRQMSGSSIRPDMTEEEIEEIETEREEEKRRRLQ